MIAVSLFTLVIDIIFIFTIFYLFATGGDMGLNIFSTVVILGLLIPWNYVIIKTTIQTVKIYKEYKKNKDKKE